MHVQRVNNNLTPQIITVHQSLSAHEAGNYQASTLTGKLIGYYVSHSCRLRELVEWLSLNQIYRNSMQDCQSLKANGTSTIHTTPPSLFGSRKFHWQVHKSPPFAPRHWTKHTPSHPKPLNFFNIHVNIINSPTLLKRSNSFRFPSSCACDMPRLTVST